MPLAIAAHACLTVLRARTLGTDKAETDPPSSSTSAWARSDARSTARPTDGPHPSTTSSTGRPGAEDDNTKPAPATTNNEDTAHPKLPTHQGKHRCSTSPGPGARRQAVARSRRSGTPCAVVWSLNRGTRSRTSWTQRGAPMRWASWRDWRAAEAASSGSPRSRWLLAW